MAFDPALKDAAIKGSLTLAQNLITAVVTAYFAVWLALKRFHFEKRWERKAEAYSNVITALHHVKDHTVHEQDQCSFELAKEERPDLQNIAAEREGFL